MALTKIKLNEVDTKADPVLADCVLLSDSADGGRGKISTLTDLQTLIGGGGGGGAVDSVAGKTGVVTLDASDIAETAALKIMTADERTKLTGIAEGAEVNTVDSVAGKTGDVTLDASDIAETAALKIMTADERTKLTGIAEGAEVNTVDSVAGKTGVVTLDADDVSTTASKLWMSDTQASKLSGIAENANNYTHPETHPQSMIEGLADALAGKAPIASPALTGTPTAPTAAMGTNTTQIATTAFVQNNDNAWRMITGRKHFDDSGTGNEGIIISRYNIQTVRVSYSIIPSSTTGLSIISIGGPSNKYASLHLENAGVVSATTAPVGTNTTQLATTEFVQAATARAIYDLPVTRSGVVSAGTDVVLLETGVLDPAWYDTTHILNVSFFARNYSGINSNTTFNVQLYDEGNSTAHTLASITADTLDFDLLQASIYRASSSSVNCNIQYGVASNGGYVSLTAGAYKLRVVCTSTLPTIFGSAQVRFTK